MTAPVVNVTNIAVLNNPTAFTNPFQFEITFECLKPLADDLEWKVTYVGCAESEKYDQELESILVGPVPVGMNKFVFQADSPDVSLIPPQDVLGVTVVLITCSYKAKSYCCNECKNGVLNRASPAEKEELSKLSEEERNEKLAPFFAEAAKTCDHPPEFIRVGYYVNNSYTDQELEDAPPERPIVEKLQREILAEKPRVTRFPILWE
jgi:histone chaperone ASF1